MCIDIIRCSREFGRGHLYYQELFKQSKSHRRETLNLLAHADTGTFFMDRKAPLLADSLPGKSTSDTDTHTISGTMHHVNLILGNVDKFRQIITYRFNK